jgi:hypothetical protein
MTRRKRDRKLEAGLEAYTQSERGSGPVVHFFRDQLSNWPVYAAAGSAPALVSGRIWIGDKVAQMAPVASRSRTRVELGETA